MGELLQIAGVNKSFGAVKVADNVDLAVGQTDALGIIGPNGAGKSTLFGLVSGSLRPDAGTILYDGQDITGLDAAGRCRLGIARSFQVPHPFVGMSVFENLLVGAIFGGGESERDAMRRCGEILDRTGLASKANLPAGSLRLLDRKRLEMARALATRPRLLLLDEIAGGLTEEECHQLVATVREVHASGVAIVWIEHVVHALLAVVDRLVVLNYGRKVAEGEPREVMASDMVQQIYMGMDDHADAAA
ncbi:ABC transporter ATP-binding protein [Rhizobium setariae]|uniref:ABC transporter ATP-binding protein n=1 Tax=Rhizobium setariae TaxID=2801340 RepID=UPI0031B9BEF4